MTIANKLNTSKCQSASIVEESVAICWESAGNLLGTQQLLAAISGEKRISKKSQKLCQDFSQTTTKQYVQLFIARLKSISMPREVQSW
jgi:hypothetical protein